MCELFQGAAADRFLDSLSGFINGLDTKNNVKVRTPDHRNRALTFFDKSRRADETNC